MFGQYDINPPFLETEYVCITFNPVVLRFMATTECKGHAEKIKR